MVVPKPYAKETTPITIKSRQNSFFKSLFTNYFLLKAASLIFSFAAPVNFEELSDNFSAPSFPSSTIFCFWELKNCSDSLAFSFNKLIFSSLTSFNLLFTYSALYSFFYLILLCTLLKISFLLYFKELSWAEAEDFSSSAVFYKVYLPFLVIF